MKKKLTFVLFMLSASVVAHTQKRIVVITASYNNQSYCKDMLKSIFFQEYENWHLIYVDDCSADQTSEIVKALTQEYGQEDRVTLIRNESHLGSAIANQYRAIHMCNDSDIIVIVDGDDRLAHQQVFAYLDEVYADPNIWLTYGQFRSHPSGSIGFCCPIPQSVIANNSFREYAHIPSHLRTFYAGLFKKIKKEDFMYEGAFFLMTGDMAAMVPMIEMAREHFRFIDNVLLIYNEANPLNDHKISVDMQRSVDRIIRSRPRYEKLEALFAPTHE